MEPVDPYPGHDDVPLKIYGANQPNVLPLPVRIDDGMLVTAWQPNRWERSELADGAAVKVLIESPGILYPMRVDITGVVPRVVDERPIWAALKELYHASERLAGLIGDAGPYEATIDPTVAAAWRMFRDALQACPG